MRTKLLVCLLAMAGLCARAQQYLVYSVVGEAHEMGGNGKQPLKPRRMVTAKTRLAIGAESAVTLLDEKNRRMCCLTDAGVSTVGQLLAKGSSSKKNLSKQYADYLVKRLFASGSQKMSHPDTYMQATATAYRSASNDSLLLGRLVAMLGQQGGQPLPAEAALAQSSTLVDTDLDVGFELVGCETGLPVAGGVRPNTSCYVRAYNHTSEVLYMNVLNIDDKGNKYLVLPVDSASTCAHLLVPPMSTVSFKSEPMIFGDSPSAEAFVLVATEEPVDFSILMAPLRYSGRETMRAGLARKIYEVK